VDNLGTILGAVAVVVAAVLPAVLVWRGQRGINASLERLQLAQSGQTAAEERALDTATDTQLREQVRVLWRERSEKEEQVRELTDALEAERDARRVVEETLEAVQAKHAGEIRGLKLRIAKLEKRLREANLPIPNGDN